ncbi:helix-turn-helix domain-containing protein [Rhodococcus qingshengii]|uniref:helix-turn-helix domain-containing protein n=1 Tax=Rhodococcus qingshengii TaxID=334542 RepID=UPI0037C56075
MASEANTDWDAWEKAAVQNLGRAIRSIRKAQGMSQAALGDAIGISKGAIMNIESKKARVTRMPSVTLLVRIAAALGVPPALLLYPDVPDRTVEFLPGRYLSAEDAIRWFAGTHGMNVTLNPMGGIIVDPRMELGVELISAIEERRRRTGGGNTALPPSMLIAKFNPERRKELPPEERSALQQIMDYEAAADVRIQELRKQVFDLEELTAVDPEDSDD